MTLFSGTDTRDGRIKGHINLEVKGNTNSNNNSLSTRRYSPNPPSQQLPLSALSSINRAPASLVQTKLIKASSLHSRLPRIQHAYAWPFLFLYPAWAFIYFFKYDEWIKSEEITFVTLGLLLTTNAMLFLTCQWSVSVKASLTCRKVHLQTTHQRRSNIFCPTKKENCGV